MSLLVDIQDMLLGQVGIDLGRGNVSMAQDFLDHPQIGPMFQQMSREAMPEGMGSHVFCNAGLLAVLLNLLPDGLPGLLPAPAVQEKIVAALALF